jgi:hypothetical protein
MNVGRSTEMVAEAAKGQNEQYARSSFGIVGVMAGHNSQ